MSTPQDIIETNLLKEIGVRSSSFFEATGLIQVSPFDHRTWSSIWTDCEDIDIHF
jgi:hypothetical protein